MNIFVDVETIPSQRADIVARIALKHMPVNAEVTEEAAKKGAAELEKTSLAGTFGELFCIGYAVDDDDPTVIMRDMSARDGERAMLSAFAAKMGFFAKQIRRVVAHNVDFDRPFIRQRAIINDVTLTSPFSDVGEKPWESRWECTMALWTNDRRGRVSLDDLCAAFGLTGKAGVDGSMVAQMVRDGRGEEVAAYCAGDVKRLRAVYQRMVRR